MSPKEPILIEDPQSGHPMLAEVHEHFERLRAQARAENIGLQVASAYRSFEKQQQIWNEKFLGERKLLGPSGKELERPEDDESLIETILLWSVPPGLSRHHWGTDLDVFDEHRIAREDLKLTPQECEEGGPCGILHQWLDDKINNKQTLFYRPYEKNCGVRPERWHLSFAPLAQDQLQHLSKESSKNKLKEQWRDQNVLGHAYLIAHFDNLFDRFVLRVDTPPSQ